MRLWFVHSSEVTIREQIVTQVTLGILSGELAAGERLPSTRELARRFRLHANTVSGAYQQLEAEGWVESQRGSGVFVRSTKPSKARKVNASQALDHLFHAFLRSTETLGVAKQDVRDYMQRWIDSPAPTHLLLIEPDLLLAKIILAEIATAGSIPVQHCFPDEDALSQKLNSAVVLTLPSKAEMVRALIPTSTVMMILTVRSVSSSLESWLPVPPDALVAVASSWPPFLEIAKTFLVSAGFSPDALLLRGTEEKNWQDGLEQTSAVVCDVCTARLLPPSIRSIPFSLLTEETIASLKEQALHIDQCNG